MKNLHLIPTEKGQRITKTNKGIFLFCSNVAKDFIEIRRDYSGFHLYITNDDEIKERDWVYCNIEGFEPVLKQKVNPMNVNNAPSMKKIILTTDQDLIKDGVQAIDDEFLQWFVKNPSCESVEVKEKQHFEADKYKRKNPLNGVYYSYKIIIPKEEPKQECKHCKQFISKYGCVCAKQTEEPKQENCCTPAGQIKRYVDCKGCDRKPKQETLEEIAERPLYFELVDKKAESNNTIDLDAYAKGVQDGVIWQQERMYSEQDLEVAYFEGREGLYSFNDWFKQFKK